MTVKLLTEHNLEFLNLKGGCTCSSESTLVKMPHCWKSHIAAQIYCLNSDQPELLVSCLHPHGKTNIMCNMDVYK